MFAIKQIKSITALIAASLLSSASFAGVISVEQYSSGSNTASESGYLGGYTMTRFDLIPATEALDTLISPVDGSSLSITANDDDGKVTVDVAGDDTGSSADPQWWTNYSGYDYNIFTTSSNRITILLPENTLAFAFNVGANTLGSAWFKAWDQDNNMDYYSGNFSVGGSGNKTPGYGLYADNSASTSGQCNYISKVVIDPTFIWGAGNFSISQDTNGNCSSEVSEPGSIALFALGLIGLAVMRRKLA